MKDYTATLRTVERIVKAANRVVCNIVRVEVRMYPVRVAFIFRSFILVSFAFPLFSH